MGRSGGGGGHGGGFGGGGMGGQRSGGGGFSSGNFGGGRSVGKGHGGGRGAMPGPSMGGSFANNVLGGLIGARIARGLMDDGPRRNPYGYTYADPAMAGMPPVNPTMPPGGVPEPDYSNPTPVRSGISGCGVVVLILGLILVALFVFALINPVGCTGDIANSTVERQALPAGSVHKTGYYTDADGAWIRDSRELEAGMKEFYALTGVQPYVYILPNGSVNSAAQISAIAQELYNQLFDDESHFLLVICDNNYGQYYYGYEAGAQAKSVMDAEAVQILIDYLDRYYFNSSYSEESMLSSAFADTANRIMTVTPSPFIPIAVIVAIIIAAGLIVFFVRHRAQQKAAEQAHVEQILSTPLEKFGEQELQDLEDKYTTNATASVPDEPLEKYGSASLDELEAKYAADKAAYEAHKAAVESDKGKTDD